MDEMELTEYQLDILGKLAACFGNGWFTLDDLWSQEGGFSMAWMRCPTATLQGLVSSGALAYEDIGEVPTHGDADTWRFTELWAGRWKCRVVYVPPPPGIYRLGYYGPGRDTLGNEVPIVNQGWRVYVKSYQTHRMGRDIQRSLSQRVPREDLLGVFETETQARLYAWHCARKDRRL